jgi:hypothetical protein
MAGEERRMSGESASGSAFPLVIVAPANVGGYCQQGRSRADGPRAQRRCGATPSMKLSSAAGVLASLILPVLPLRAELIEMELTAVVSYVDDYYGLFPVGTFNEGDVITGVYRYDTGTPNTGSVPWVGDYRHTTAGYGFDLTVNGYNFRTDPAATDYLFEMIDGMAYGAGTADGQVMHSYYNIFPFDTTGYNYADSIISWQMVDFSATVLNSIALPTEPPVLANWTQFGLDLSFSGYTSSWSYKSFFLRAYVTSVQKVAQTPAQQLAKLLDTVSGLGAPVSGSLGAKLQAALAAVNRGASQAAAGQLKAFVNEVAAQKGKKLTADQAASLTAAAEKILAKL